MRSFMIPLLSVLLLVAAPAPAAIVFSETLNDSLVHITDTIHSPDHGIVPGAVFDVDKYIENGSLVTLINYEIALKVCESLRSACLPAGSGNDISFVAGDYWVDKNAVIMDPSLWSATLTSTPEQQLLFRFGFPVEPDDVLSIHFKMVDNKPTGSYWSLVQTANTPEPGTFLLVSIGVLLCFTRKIARN